MAKKDCLSGSKLVKYRQSLGENQSTFWGRFGVTQSGGSRYESGRKVPTPTAILLLAFLEGAIEDAMLHTLKGRIK